MTAQHDEAKRLLPIVVKAAKLDQVLRYQDAAELLGRPKNNARAVAQVCDLLDAAAALANVPLLALVVVRTAENKINPKAWTGKDVEPGIREGIISRSKGHRYIDQDFKAIAEALDKLKGHSNRTAWQYLSRLMPAVERRRQLAGMTMAVNNNAISDLDDLADDTPSQSYADLCAYTIKHSDSLAGFAGGGRRTFNTGGRSWARIAALHAGRSDGEIIPLLFAPAENFIKITACADIESVKTLKNDGINSVTFSNFRFLSPPILKSSVKREGGESLRNYQREYAICRTPTGLAERLILSLQSETADVTGISADPDIADETVREALIEARRGQGQFRAQLDRRWGHACAVTGCSIRELLRASHIKPWSISTNRERLDPQNGFLLSATIDILFDKGFVSFSDKGEMLISPRLSAAEQRQLGLPKDLRRKPDSGEQGYLAQHRSAFKINAKR